MEIYIIFSNILKSLVILFQS